MTGSDKASRMESRDLEIRYRRLSVLYDIALTLGKSLNLQEILKDSLDKLIEIMEVDSGVIYVIDTNTQEMIPMAFRNLSDEVVRDLRENRVTVGECMCGMIAQCGEEVLIAEKASQDPRFTRPALKTEGMEFYAGLPVKAQERVVGVLCAITHESYVIDEGLLDILRAATVPLGLAIENARLFQDTLRRADESTRLLDFEGVVGASDAMRHVLAFVRKVTDVESGILITGESGTGKELIAKALHSNSRRKSGPFVIVNCSAVPESLLESEFFGYVKGAFTGAVTDKTGLFEAANHGTLFLDEVEAMSPGLQAKLLRVLQNGTFTKVGDTRPVIVDVRIIAATNRDLLASVKNREFRSDLYYRLNVIRIDLPPLRDRTVDIPILARNFLQHFSHQMGKNVTRFSPDTIQTLMAYPWPGNVRELENAIQRAIAMAEEDLITTGDLPPEISVRDENGHRGTLRLEEVERNHIVQVLRLCGGNQREAARLLGIDKTTLWRKLKKYEEVQNAVRTSN